MFHKKCFTEQGRPSAVRHRCGNCFTWIVSRRDFGRLCRFVRFWYTQSVPPLLFRLVLRFACVLLCVAFVLRLKIKRICDDRIKLDKIYGFPFFVRLRAYFGACLFSPPFIRPPSVKGRAVPIFWNRPYPLYYLTILQIKNFFTFMGKFWLDRHF